jgi:hypothetical protein
MPPREFQVAREKREELKTYRELTLRRDLKSVRQRRRIEADGKQRVLGNGSVDRPYLIVPTSRYREVRLETQRRLLREARRAGLDLAVDLLLEQLAPRLEAAVYAQLAQESDEAVRHHLPMAALGRALTATEKDRFAASCPSGPALGKARRPVSHGALDQVLGRIEARQVHNPARYRTVWAQLVGPDAAQQTELDRIDAATQTAYFRCLNSVLSNDLQRRPGLPQKLGRALGVPVRRLRAQF